MTTVTEAVARRRAWLVAAAVVVIIVAGSTVFWISGRRADAAMATVRARAATTTVSGSDLLGEMFSADHAVARGLGVDPADTALSSRGAGQWCLTVTVRRAVAVRTAAYTVRPDRPLVPTDGC